MRKIYSFMVGAVAMFAAVSCAQELSQNITPAGGTKVYSAVADGNETKAALDGKATNWEKGDAILIYDGASAAKYVTSIEAPAAKADFEIAAGETAPAGNKVIAVYPEWADGYKSSVADVAGKTLSKAYLTPTQNAKVGSYDPNTAIAMAYSEDAHLEFKNATALLKFTVANENVKTVTIYSVGGEKLTGEWALDYNDGAPKATPGESSEGWVELSAGDGTFEVGKEYYISVYPQTLASGFGLEFGFEGVSQKQLVKKYESSVEFNRNVILNLGNLEFTGTIEPEEPEEVVVDYWAVVGSMTNEWNSEIKMILDGDWYVAENVKITATDQFKFRANGNWDETTPNRGAAGEKDGVIIADNVETEVFNKGKNFSVAKSGFYSLYLNKAANKAKVVKTADLPVEVTPDQPSEWALVGAFTKGDSNWKEIRMVTTSTPELFVAKNVVVPVDYTSMLIKKFGDANWSVKYGGGIVYFNPGNWMALSSGGSDISITKAGTYDFYFDLAGKKLYVVAVGADYKSVPQQTKEGEEPEQEEPEVTEKVVYLKPNSNWIQSNARFAIYVWGGTPGEKWVSMTDADKDGIYEAHIPEGYDYGCNIIFCRMNPSTTANNWNNKWNQTSDLKTPTDGNNLYTVKDGTWDKGGGTWSKK